MAFSAIEMAGRLANGTTTSRSLVEAAFGDIEKFDATFKSFLATFKLKALEDADRIDARRKAGEKLPFLAGVPVAIKDNINVLGEKTTCASKILENFVSPYDATVIAKLKAAGLVIIGKTNMDEFAMGSSTEHSAYGFTANPWNKDYVPGGSSGGSATAVGAGFVPLSLGSDTGGSIRQPASFCGVVGLKPTYGRVSRYGLVAFASSLDQIGPFGKTVDDVAALLSVISGVDPRDATSETVPVPDFLTSSQGGIDGLRIGIPEELISERVDPEVRALTLAVLDRLKSRGASWEPFKLGNFDDAVSAYYIIAPAEASANLERYDGVRYGHRALADNLHDMMARSRGEGFGPEVKRRIILGTFVLSAGYYDAYYLKAQKVRTLVTDQFNQAFKNFDVVATPTSPILPFKKGEMLNDPMAMYLADVATIPVNLAGLPGISVPAGFSNSGLPIGIQLIGKLWDEATLLRVARHIEAVCPETQQSPNLEKVCHAL